ncbi:MAG: cell division protein ZapA [Sphingomonas sp.]
MAEVTLRIGNRDYRIACRDGSEAQLTHVSRLLDDRWAAASQAAGGLNDERTMLFVALMLADALDETQARGAHQAAATGAAADDKMLDRVAVRLEQLAKALEDGLDTP